MYRNPFKLASECCGARANHVGKRRKRTNILCPAQGGSQAHQAQRDAVEAMGWGRFDYNEDTL